MSVALVIFAALTLITSLFKVVLPFLVGEALTVPETLVGVFVFILSLISCAIAVFAGVSAFVKKLNRLTNILVTAAAYPVVSSLIVPFFSIIINTFLNRYGTDFMGSALYYILRLVTILVAIAVTVILAVAIAIISKTVFKEKKNVAALIGAIAAVAIALLASLIQLILVLQNFRLIGYVINGYYDAQIGILIIMSYIIFPLITIGANIAFAAGALLAFFTVPSQKTKAIIPAPKAAEPVVLETAEVAATVAEAEVVSEVSKTPIEETAKPVEEASPEKDAITVEILKYKKLYDAGAITEEEFSAKKRQIMGL